MPKVKSHSGAKKRFNFTKNGKVKRRRANATHLLNNPSKNSKRKRRMRKGDYVDVTDVKAVREMIPYKVR